MSKTCKLHELYVCQQEAIDLVEHKLTAPPSLTPLTSRVTVKLDSIPQPLSIQTQNDAKSLPPSGPVTPTGGVKPPLTRKDETPPVQPKVSPYSGLPKNYFVALSYHFKTSV